MVAIKRAVVWSDEAKAELKSIYKYILQDSPKNATKVRSDVVDITRKLSLNPDQHAPDKYKLNNDGSYRAFEKHKYRVVYRIRENEIRVLRVRHTKMEPLEY